MSNDLMSSRTETAEFPQPEGNHRRKRRQLVAGAALIFLLVLAAYWPALGGQFIWDDLILVEKNPLLTGEFGLRSIWFKADFPLTTIAFWVQWLLWGNNPLGYHAVNVLLHAVSAVLLWRLLARLGVRGGWLAAAIFAVHPVCVTSVAWISELKNTLSLPFYLLSLQWYLCFEELQAQDQSAKAARWYWLSLGAFLLALLSKTTTVMLPLVLLSCAWWQRGRIARQDWLRTAPFFMLSLAMGCLTVWFQRQAIAGEMVQTEGFAGRLAGVGMAIWFYLGKVLLPLNLNMIYPHWTIDATAPLSYLPLLLWCGVMVLCWRWRRSWGRQALLGLGCFAINLFPALGFFDMYFLAFSRVSDHLQYLPLIAVVALAAAGLRSLPDARVVGVLAIPIVLALSFLSWQRAQVFASDERLWRDTLAKNPKAWCAHNNLGSILAEQQRYDEAIDQFRASLQANPENAQALCNLGRALSLQGKYSEAEGHFVKALKIRPDDATIHRAYASALAAQGRREEAIKQLREALRLKPEIETRLQLAPLLHQTGQSREAVAQLRQVLVLKPDLAKTLNNLALLLATCSDSTVRDGPEAVRLAERACRLTDYRQAQMVGTLAAAYAETGRFADAMAASEKAIELATADGNTRFAALYQKLLNLYRAGKPFHEPPAKVTPPPRE